MNTFRKFELGSVTCELYACPLLGLNASTSVVVAISCLQLYLPGRKRDHGVGVLSGQSYKSTLVHPPYHHH